MAPTRQRQNPTLNWVQRTPMNSKLSAIFLGAGILVACMAALPSGDAAEPGPIQIENLHTDGGFYQDAIHDMNVLPASLEITFENRSNADATDIVFNVDADGFADRFNDVGRFARGVQIRHSFPVNPFSVTGNIDVQVVQVSFADGTVWQNPGAP
jgi:hypothetical protein